jgi:DNA-binding NarL/FixJ family response regulator
LLAVYCAIGQEDPVTLLYLVQHGQRQQLPGDRAGTRVLVLSTSDDDDYVYGALPAGASGFLVKDMALEDILTAIRVVAGGDAVIVPGVTRRRAVRNPARCGPQAPRAHRDHRPRA